MGYIIKTQEKEEKCKDCCYKWNPSTKTREIIQDFDIQKCKNELIKYELKIDKYVNMNVSYMENFEKRNGIGFAVGEIKNIKDYIKNLINFYPYKNMKTLYSYDIYRIANCGTLIRIQSSSSNGISIKWKIDKIHYSVYHSYNSMSYQIMEYYKDPRGMSSISEFHSNPYSFTKIEFECGFFFGFKYGVVRHIYHNSFSNDTYEKEYRYKNSIKYLKFIYDNGNEVRMSFDKNKTPISCECEIKDHNNV